MVAIVRFIGPLGKSFITTTTTWRVRPEDVTGIIWDRAIKKYGPENFRREVLWQGEASDSMINRELKKFIKEFEPEFNV
jgi:hypothetical protein